MPIKMPSKISVSRLILWADTMPPTKKTLPYRAAHTLCRVIFITLQEFSKNELALRAAALTFTVMLSLVPILAMSTAVVKGLGGGDQLKKVIYSYVGTLERDQPNYQVDSGQGTGQDGEEQDSSLTGHLYSAVDRLFDYVERTNFATLGTIGVAGILVSVVLVLGNIEMAMNAIWHVESGRSVARKISDYLALIVLMPISVNIGLAASAVLMNESLLTKFSILMPMDWIQAIILNLIPIFFLALTLYVIYLFFPNTRVKTIPAAIGALFAGFFWFEVQNLYMSLQIGVARYNAIYGSFATLPLFLVWIYFGWIFILAGAQIAYAYQNRDTLRLREIERKPSLKLAVAFDLIDYIYHSFEEGKSVSVATFSRDYPMHDLTLVEEILGQLKNNDLLHTAADDSSIRPSKPREKLDQSSIVKAIVGAVYSETDGGRKSRKLLETAANMSAEDSEKNQEIRF